MSSNLYPPVKIAVLPVAGLGTRLLPATKIMPKEMLTVVDRPLIQMAVEEGLEAGIEHFVFVMRQGKELLLRHFDHAAELLELLRNKNRPDMITRVEQASLPEKALQVVAQNEALGLGHAVWCARDLVENEPFAVILPDDTVRAPRSCLAQMMDVYRSHGGNVVGTCEVPPHDSSRYGMLEIAGREGNVLEITGLVEKPAPADAPSNMAIFGRYILQPQIFDHLARHEKGVGGEIQLTDAMARLLRDMPFYGCVFEGERLDCGYDLGFIKAQIAFGLERENIAPELLAYMREKLAATEKPETVPQSASRAV